jgi:hypothetical protein
VPASAPSATSLAGAALYVLLFAAALWGTWALVRTGPGGDGPS